MSGRSREEEGGGTEKRERTLIQRHRAVRGERASSEGLRQLRFWGGTVRGEKPGRTEFTPRLGQEKAPKPMTEQVLCPGRGKVDNSSARGSTKLGGSDLAVGNREVRGKERGTRSRKG